MEDTTSSWLQLMRILLQITTEGFFYLTQSCLFTLRILCSELDWIYSVCLYGRFRWRWHGGHIVDPMYSSGCYAL